ncbi:transposase [Pandoraea communis]|uniref:Transposase n=1 Tax=Pandoraea communis TaxID=2508297 RepID=A0A5E4SGB5_9BURK|nr:transposase [Pandoraea communis]
MLRIHFMQQWFGLSDVAMEEALYDVPLYRQFTGLGGMSRLSDRVSILRFRHLLERQQLAEQFLLTVNAQLSAKGYLLKEGTAVDATLIAAPSLAKNQSGERDPEMHRTKKGQPVALRHEGAYWRRNRLGIGPFCDGHGGYRSTFHLVYCHHGWVAPWEN